MATINPKYYEIKFEDKFFFDTNIWLMLYSNIANFQENDLKLYSTFLESLITRDKPIFITSMVISEFANAILKFDFNQSKIQLNFTNKNFKKDYVGSENYKNSVSKIASYINSILKLPNLLILGDEFNAINKDEILQKFNHVDFNDAYYTVLAKKNNYIIVTNDRDFQFFSDQIEIITTKI